MEELHAGVVELAGGGEGDDFGEGAEEHVGVANARGGRTFCCRTRDRTACHWSGPGFGDGFFDEGLFDAGAHVAGGEFDEVLHFVGSGAGEEIEEEAKFGGGSSGFGDGSEGGFDVGEGDGGGSGRTAVEEVGGGGSDVAVAAVGGGHVSLARAGEFGDGFAEEATADRENAAVGFGEGRAGEPEGGASCIGDGEGAEVVGDEGAFFEFFGGGGEGVVELGEVEEEGHGRQVTGYRVQGRFAPSHICQNRADMGHPES